MAVGRLTEPLTEEVFMLPAPALRHLCDLTVELDPILELGPAPEGKRRIIPIVGGSFSGERLQGRLLHLGADWQWVRPDAVAELDARYAMETDDGALIEIRNFGYRHGPPDILEALARGEEPAPETYYMRTLAQLVTGDERYRWLNRILCLGTGARKARAVELTLYEVE